MQTEHKIAISVSVSYGYSAANYMQWLLNQLLLVNFITKTRLFKMNVLKILQPKNENFQIKISDIFHISAQNIDCEAGGSNKYPQSML